MRDSLLPRKAAAGAVLYVLLALIGVTGSPSQEESPSDRRRQAVESTAARASAEEQKKTVDSLLERTLAEYKVAARLRRQSVEALRAAQAKLDAEIEKEKIEELKLDTFVLAVAEAQATLTARHDLAHDKLTQLRDLLRRQEILQTRLSSIEATKPTPRKETLSGSWNVDWQPTGQKGLFHLEQSGALVSGRYQIGSTSSGSLQGTFVNGRLYLQRIDRKGGRDAELEGILKGDTIEGTWQMYELVQGGLPQGRWVASRVE